MFGCVEILVQSRNMQVEKVQKVGAIQIDTPPKIAGDSLGYLGNHQSLLFNPRKDKIDE